MNITVAGTGYVGLSISILLAQHNKVIACDIMQNKVDLINSKISPIVDKEISEYLVNKTLNLSATCDTSRAYKNPDFVVIATPTNYDSEKNFFDTSSIETVLSIVEKMNGKLEIKIDEINVFKSNLVGTTISLDENPDLGPILFGLAAFTSTPTKFTNIKRLRIKESNRIDSMIYNLKLLGIKVEEIDEDNLIIYPGTITKPKETLKSFHDHRIFMTLCIITSLLDEVTIDDETCINKSYPNFLYDLNSLKDGD